MSAQRRRRKAIRNRDYWEAPLVGGLSRAQLALAAEVLTEAGESGRRLPLSEEPTTNPAQ